MKHLKNYLVVAMSVAFVACAEQKKLSEMHDSTVEMNGTTKELLGVTKEMRETTEDLGKTTAEMRETTQEVVTVSKAMSEKMDGMSEKTVEVVRVTDELYDSSRQGVSLQLRRDALDALLRAQSGGKKLEEAAAYFMSFEYQLWTGWGVDGAVEKREELLRNAVEEFLKALHEFTIKGDVAPFSESSGDAHALHGDDNKQASFNALAAAVHSVNRKQEEMAHKNPQHQIVSMYGILLESLKLEKDVNEGLISLESLKSYQRVVLVNKELVVRLLQARHNHIPVIFLSKVLPQNGLRNRWQAGLNYYLSWGAKWKLDMDALNLTQLKEYSKYLEASLATRASLSELGIEPVVDGTLSAFMKGARPETQGKGGGEINAARTELFSLITEHQK